MSREKWKQNPRLIFGFSCFLKETSDSEPSTRHWKPITNLQLWSYSLRKMYLKKHIP